MVLFHKRGVLSRQRARDSNLQQLRESFHNPGILVAVYLYRVDERNLRLWVVAERFENFRESLKKNRTRWAALGPANGKGMRGCEP